MNFLLSNNEKKISQLNKKLMTNICILNKNLNTSFDTFENANTNGTNYWNYKYNNKYHKKTRIISALSWQKCKKVII